MHFLALAADYDGTIAHHGSVNAETCEALGKLKATGRRLVLVTGRELADLTHTFPKLELFDAIVAENGAVTYDPTTRRERSLAPAPSAHLVEKLMERKVEPISVGRSIIATWEPHQTTVLAAIQELGLEAQIIFNKGAVMVLPSGVNKASGLRAALRELDISPHNVVAVGDAENDHAFMHACGCAAAVANALPTIKEEADIQLSGDHGKGVVELIERIIRYDVQMVPPSRSGILLGIDRRGEHVFLEAGRRILIVGASSAGKSRFATLLTERMVGGNFEFCIFDPEGDYEGLESAISIGDRTVPPAADEVIALIRQAAANVVINALALNLPERQRLFAKLLPAMAELRARTGRPHWLIVDEASHVLPVSNQGVWKSLSGGLSGTLFITVDSASLAADVVEAVDIVLAFGSAASEALASFATRRKVILPAHAAPTDQSEVLFWSVHSAAAPMAIKISTPRQMHRRHAGKYAVGTVGERQSFYFRGPANTGNVSACNLLHFLECASKIDDATWDYHLRAGDYSKWFRHVIKDDGLASEAETIEANFGISPLESRHRIRDAVARRYMVLPESSFLQHEALPAPQN